MPAILDIFGARRGIIAAVGAGGKKSTLNRLINEHQGKIALTSTVFTPRYRKRMNMCEVIAGEESLMTRLAEAAQYNNRIAYAHPSKKTARLGGVLPATVDAVHNKLGFDATFVKADGARFRWLKSPEHNKPVLPPGINVLISLLSVRAIGKPVSDEIAHHAPEVARAMGIELGQIVSAAHMARLMSQKYSVLGDAVGVRVIPVLNMVESKEDLRLGRLVAEQALSLSDHFDRVVLASMIKDEPIVEVII